MADETNPFHSIIHLIEDVNSPLSFGRSGDNPPYVYAFQLKCKNAWDKPLEIAGASFISEVEQRFVMAGVIMNAKPIPVGSEFVIVGILPPVEGSGMEGGLYFDDFRKEFGSFSAKIELADGSYVEWAFDAAKVEELLAAGEKAMARDP